MTAVEARTGVRRWMLDGLADSAGDLPGPHGKVPKEHRRHAWWKVMCLTGVDYFSTLGYQPGIAALAAGAVAPIATIVLVALTLFGALPVYRRVARESPHGEGSIAMLEKILPWWAGKLFVLVLLGFACTDFLITMTLSAADATAHVLENPFAPHFIEGHAVLVTLVFLAALGAVFLRGFKEAIGIAVVLVVIYLILNAVVLVSSVVEIAHNPQVFGDWHALLMSENQNWFAVAAVALIVFPKLALGLSGFETGVAVMPQIEGLPTDTEANPAGRIAGARRLLLTAAVIMSVFLVLSSIATTLLIPPKAFEIGGQANGRALAFLAHEQLGATFGTVYDVSTIAILWFAGASAMAGLLNLVPRYLPRYGMAPSWARAMRPLVLVFMAVAFFVTWYFKASVDAQGGAYATGVLVLITSASVAVTLTEYRRKHRRTTISFAAVSLVFIYTTIANIFERPDGVKIGGIFILAIVVVSFVSRTRRSLELRAVSIDMDDIATGYIKAAAKSGTVRLIPKEPGESTARIYQQKTVEARNDNGVPAWAPLIFLEVMVSDASDFEADLKVVGQERFGYRILRVHSSVIANTIAALLIEIRDSTGTIPHAYFSWTEGNPIINFIRFLFVGDGEVATMTREVLREAEPDPDQRPRVHVG